MQLTAAHAAIAKLETAAPFEDAVETLIRQKLEAIESKQEKDLDGLLEARDQRISLLAEGLAEQDEVIIGISNDLDDLTNTVPPTCAKCESLEASIDTLRRDFLSRLDAFEARSALQAVPAAAAAPAAAPPGRSRAVSFASPALSDPPPTQSLVSFETPTGSPATPVLAQDSPFAHRQSTGLRKATPFKLGAAASAGEDAPATAVPSHMLAVAGSATRRAQRGTPLATYAALAAGEPESPAPLPANASLGKHARTSDASDQSIVLAALDSPAAATPAARRTATAVDGADGFVTAPNSVRKASAAAAQAGASASARKDAHARKKVRVSSGAMSTGTIIDHGEDAERFTDDEGEEPVDSFRHDEPQQLSTPGRGDNDEDLQSDADDEVRDYLVATKTGDSPSTAVRAGPAAAARASSPAPSIHDPAFFSCAVSPSAPTRSTTPSRRTFSFANENVPASPVAAAAATASGRKSLPLAALPFPLVSPFRAAPSPGHASRVSKSARKATPGAGTGASGRKATMTTFFGGDAANRATSSATGGAAGLFSAAAAASATKPRGRSSTVSAAAAAAPPTPLAPRTLFGTEGDAGEGRFGEGEGAGVEVSPEKGWRWERGAFGGAAGAF